MSRRLLYPIAVAALAASTFVVVSWAEAVGVSTPTNESASPPTTELVSQAPILDIAAVEAAIAEQVVGHIAAVEKEQEAQRQAARRAAAPATTPNYDPGTGDRWDRLAKCECGGNWACNTGNGFGGGLQFMHQRSYSTWLSFGGGEFAPHPWEASREEQIIVAERVLARSGWGAWPGCSRSFGWL